MFNRQEITPAEKLARDSLRLSSTPHVAKTGSPAPLLFSARGCVPVNSHVDENKFYRPLPSFSKPELQTGYVGPSPIFSKQDMYQLNRMWSSTTVNSAINQSDTFRSICRPIRDKLGSYGYAGLERIICMLILFSQYVINSFTLYTLNKVCIGPLCLYQRSKVNPELPRT